MFGDVFKLTKENLEIHNLNSIKLELDISNNKHTGNDTESACSSRSSNTSNGDDDSESLEDISDNSLESCSNSDMSDYSSSLSNEEHVRCEVFDFPVQIICLEKMDNTLDSLLEDEENELSTDEWKSCLFQVVISLLVYKKIFNFTHNDLSLIHISEPTRPY